MILDIMRLHSTLISWLMSNESNRSKTVFSLLRGSLLSLSHLNMVNGMTCTYFYSTNDNISNYLRSKSGSGSIYSTPLTPDLLAQTFSLSPEKPGESGFSFM